MSRRYPPSRYENLAKASTDPEELAEFAQRRSTFVRSAVARNRHARADTLTALAADDSPYVRSAAAGNPNTPVAALTALSKDRDEFIVLALAQNPSTPVEVLTDLYRTVSDPRLARWLAEHPHASAAILAELSGHADAAVRGAVARNSNTADEVVIRLSEDRADWVSKGLYERNRDRNTRFRQVVRSGFNGVRSTTDLVRIPIEEGGRFSEPVLRAFARAEGDLRLAKVVASQPDSPRDLLAQMARHEDVWVRVRVAENPASDEAVLCTLLDQGGSEVVQAIAARSDLSDAVLEAIATSKMTRAHQKLPEDAGVRLLGSTDPQARAAAAKVLYPSATEAWQQMLSDPERKVRVAAAKAVGAALLDTQVGHACGGVRQVVAERSRDPEVLRTLAGDVAVVRRRVARNPACPTETLMMLAEDPDARVRGYAAQRVLDALTGHTPI